MDPRVAAMLAAAAQVHGWSPSVRAEIDAVFAGSMAGTEAPVTRHPLTQEACHAALADQRFSWRDPEAERVCGRPYMRPLFDPATETAADARVCIDTFEFPDLPCVYPVVWVRASEAAAICAAQGKRLCDAHEWEGACAGALGEPDYRFDLARGRSASDAVRAMRAAHNAALDGPEPAWPAGACATGSEKSPGCDGSDPRRCGSNTYPAGAFPQCRSPLGVADLYGNAAEHLSLPLTPDRIGTGAGVTEMKGAWFVWDTIRAHDDRCRWRAPYWHGTPVTAPDSHRNYHLGFRCCVSR